MLAWIFLAVSCFGLLLTLNAYRPPRIEVVSPFAFFPGWLVSELPVQSMIGQAGAAIGFVAAGALRGAPGWGALGATAVSCAGLIGLVAQAQRAGHVLDEALDEQLEPRWRKVRDTRLSSEGARVVDRAQLVFPFWMRDRRVEKISGIDYWGDGRRSHRLDIYRPRQPERPGPVLVYIHGGAWVIGDKREQGLPLMLYLASQGWVCVTINYRLSPRAGWPDHLVDCKRAVAWVRENIAGYGGDPSFVAVSGGSAGGHLAALVGLTAGDRRYQPGFEGAYTGVDACVPFYGVYDFTNRHQLRHPGAVRLAEMFIVKARLRDRPDLFRDISPLDQVRGDAPPFMVVHGRNDILVPVQEARNFVRALRECATHPVVYAELPGAQHAFEVFRSIRTAHAVAAVTDYLAYVRSAVRDARSGQARSAG